MEQRPPHPDDGRVPPTTAVVPWTRPEPPVLGLTGFLRRASDLGLGAASIATTAAVDAIERFVPGEPADPEDEVSAPGLVRLVPGALMGAGLVAQRRMLDVSARVERGLAGVAASLARAPIVGGPVRATEGYLERWSDAGEVEQARNRALVTEFVRRLAPELATAVVAQLDMNSLMGQLPIDAVVATVDIDALLDRVNVEGIIDRVDVEKIIDRVDVEKIIDRVDVNAIVGRVDVQGIMGRVDIAPMAQEIIAEVDIGAIVRQSTGSITGDAVDGGRVTAMRLDGFVDRVTDRILLRRKTRNLVVPGYDPEAPEEDA
ncbi:MAG TPA: hypothetical protein VGN59_04175 [Acidimicrobiia bacterium]|jgi:hypothetical protein